MILSASLELIANFPGMLSIHADGIIFLEFDDLSLGRLPHPQDINDFLRLLITPDHDSHACPEKCNSKQEKWDAHKSCDNTNDEPAPHQGENQPEQAKNECSDGPPVGKQEPPNILIGNRPRGGWRSGEAFIRGG